MQRPITRIAKGIGATGLALSAAWASTEDELAIDIIVLGLVFGAAFVVFFGKALSTRIKATVFLLSVVAVQRATFIYYWSGVHAHGLPWPWKADSAGPIIGSVALQMGQISTMSFGILMAIASILIASHYKPWKRWNAQSGT